VLECRDQSTVVAERCASRASRLVTIRRLTLIPAFQDHGEAGIFLARGAEPTPAGLVGSAAGVVSASARDRTAIGPKRLPPGSERSVKSISENRA